MKRDHPELFDDEGELIASLTTNAMEGGNWRLKYELRTPYNVTKSISGRMNLIALGESLHTFKNGKPNKSWAQENSKFQLADVMSIKTRKTSQKTRQTPNKSEKTTIYNYNETTINPTDRPIQAYDLKKEK